MNSPFVRPERLVEYLVQVGLHEPLCPLQKETDKPITDLYVVYGKEEAPDGYDKLEFSVSGGSGNLSNGGNVFSTAVYLCVSRAPHPDGPITDMTILYLDRDDGGKLPPGYTVLDADLNKGSYGYSVVLCYTRKHLHGSKVGPVLDIGIVNESKHDVLPPCYAPVGISARRNVNAGSFRDEIYLCARHAIRDPLQVHYKPAVIDRFPRTELRGAPMPASIALFCCPEGIQLVSSAHGPPPATYSAFVLTTDASVELYCACLTFYESFHGELPPVEDEDDSSTTTTTTTAKPTTSTTPSSSTTTPSSTSSVSSPNRRMASYSGLSFSDLTTPLTALYVPRKICILSYWPFYSNFCAYLEELYRASRITSRIPIERLVMNLWETPLPRSGRIRVQLEMGGTSLPLTTTSSTTSPFSLSTSAAATSTSSSSTSVSSLSPTPISHGSGGRVILFDRPNSDDFPLANFPLTLLFRTLSLPNIIIVLSAILQEKKVIMASKTLPLLTYVGETIRSLIFPLKWGNPYVPILPIPLSGMLDAPMPIFVGVAESFLDTRALVGDDLVFVYLDRDEIRIGGNTQAAFSTYSLSHHSSGGSSSSSTSASTSAAPSSTSAAASSFSTTTSSSSSSASSSGSNHTGASNAAVFDLPEKLPHLTLIPEKLVNRLVKELLIHTNVFRLRRFKSQREIESYFRCFRTSSSSISTTGSSGMGSTGTGSSAVDLMMEEEEESNMGSSRGSHDPTTNILAIRACFLHVFVTLLAGMDDFLLFPPFERGSAHDFGELFNLRGFLATSDPKYRVFLQAIADTQMFNYFVEEKTYSTDPTRGMEMSFFLDAQHYEQELESAMEALKKKGGSALANSAPSLGVVLHLSQPSSNHATYLVPSPDGSGLNSQLFSYAEFPRRFDLSLFRRPRPVDLKYMRDAANLLDASRRKQARDEHSFQLTTARRNAARHFVVGDGTGGEKKNKNVTGDPSKMAIDANIKWAKHMLCCVYACWFELAVVCMNLRGSAPLSETVRQAFEALSRLSSQGVAPDEGIYRAGLIMCGRASLKDEAARIFHIMKNSGVKPSANTYGAYTRAVAEAEASFEAEAKGKSKVNTTSGGSLGPDQPALPFAPPSSSDAFSFLPPAAPPPSASLLLSATTTASSNVAGQPSAPENLCHHCGLERKPEELLKCTRQIPFQTGARTRMCKKKYCQHCLTTIYVNRTIPQTAEEKSKWVCFACTQTCACTNCASKVPTISSEPSMMTAASGRGSSDANGSATTPSGVDPYRAAFEKQARIVLKAARQQPLWSTLRMGVGDTCQNCNYALSEAEVMAGWSYDAASYMTRCTRCTQSFVPSLLVQVVILTHPEAEESDKKEGVYASSSFVRKRRKASGNSNSADANTLKRKKYNISVPFLSPLVLRSELTTALQSFKEDFYSMHTFRALHEILYWNLMWQFTQPKQSLPIDILTTMRNESAAATGSAALGLSHDAMSSLLLGNEKNDFTIQRMSVFDMVELNKLEEQVAAAAAANAVNSSGSLNTTGSSSDVHLNPAELTVNIHITSPSGSPLSASPPATHIPLLRSASAQSSAASSNGHPLFLHAQSTSLTTSRIHHKTIKGKAGLRDQTIKIQQARERSSAASTETKSDPKLILPSPKRPLTNESNSGAAGSTSVASSSTSPDALLSDERVVAELLSGEDSSLKALTKSFAKPHTSSFGNSEGLFGESQVEEDASSSEEEEEGDEDGVADEEEEELAPSINPNKRAIIGDEIMKISTAVSKLDTDATTDPLKGRSSVVGGLIVPRQPKEKIEEMGKGMTVVDIHTRSTSDSSNASPSPSATSLPSTTSSSSATPSNRFATPLDVHAYAKSLQGVNEKLQDISAEKEIIKILYEADMSITNNPPPPPSSSLFKSSAPAVPPPTPIQLALLGAMEIFLRNRISCRASEVFASSNEKSDLTGEEVDHHLPNDSSDESLMSGSSSYANSNRLPPPTVVGMKPRSISVSSQPQLLVKKNNLLQSVVNVADSGSAAVSSVAKSVAALPGEMLNSVSNALSTTFSPPKHNTSNNGSSSSSSASIATSNASTSSRVAPPSSASRKSMPALGVPLPPKRSLSGESIRGFSSEDALLSASSSSSSPPAVTSDSLQEKTWLPTRSHFCVRPWKRPMIDVLWEFGAEKVFNRSWVRYVENFAVALGLLPVAFKDEVTLMDQSPTKQVVAFEVIFKLRAGHAIHASGAADAKKSPNPPNVSSTDNMNVKIGQVVNGKSSLPGQPSTNAPGVAQQQQQQQQQRVAPPPPPSMKSTPMMQPPTSAVMSTPVRHVKSQSVASSGTSNASSIFSTPNASNASHSKSASSGNLNFNGAMNATGMGNASNRPGIPGGTTGPPPSSANRPMPTATSNRVFTGQRGPTTAVFRPPPPLLPQQQVAPPPAEKKDTLTSIIDFLTTVKQRVPASPQRTNVNAAAAVANRGPSTPQRQPSGAGNQRIAPGSAQRPPNSVARNLSIPLTQMRPSNSGGSSQQMLRQNIPDRFSPAMQRSASTPRSVVDAPSQQGTPLKNPNFSAAVGFQHEFRRAMSDDLPQPPLSLLQQSRQYASSFDAALSEASSHVSNGSAEEPRSESINDVPLTHDATPDSSPRHSIAL